MKHTFSKQIKNVFLCISLVIVGCTATIPFLSYATTQDDLDQANRQHESYKDEQASLSNDVSQLNDNLNAVGERISSLDQQINEKQDQIDQLQQKLVELETQKNHQYDSMKLRIRFMYERSTTDAFEILLSSKNLGDLLVRSEYIQKISDYDRKMLQQMQDIITVTNDTQTQLASDMQELTALKSSEESEQDNLKTLLAKKQQEVEVNNKNVEDAEALALKYEEQLEQQRIAQEKAEAEQASREAAAAQSAQNETSVAPGTPINYDASDLAMLAAIIECEAGNQSYQGKLAVGSVVINRVNNKRFANSISGVILSPSQFTPVASGRFAIVLQRGANATCTQAAQEVLNGNIVINALYFHVYHSDIDTYGTVIGDHIFY